MKSKNLFCALSTITLLAGTTALADDDQFALTVKVSGATPALGQAVIAVFTTRESFLKTPLMSKSVPIDKNGRAFVQIKGLAKGTYAISAYYDHDNNGRLNTGLFGIPTELVGFSNDAKGIFGPPAFRKAAFSLSGAHSVDIRFGKAKE